MKQAKNSSEKLKDKIPYANGNWPGLTPIGPPMWQAELTQS